MESEHVYRIAWTSSFPSKELHNSSQAGCQLSGMQRLADVWCRLTVTQEETIKRNVWKSQSVCVCVCVWGRACGCQTQRKWDQWGRLKARMTDFSHTDHCETERVWMRPNTIHLCRKEIRELGMTLVINARKMCPPLHLFKALLMAQVKPTGFQTATYTQTHDRMCQTMAFLCV